MSAVYQVKDSYKWVVLAVSFLLMVTFALSLQALPPLFDQIMKDIPFSNSQAGMLMGAYAVPGIFLPFLVAFFAKRFDLKKMILIALLIIVIGLIAFSLSGSFALLLVNRVVAGIGATVLVVLAPLLVTMFFGQKNIGMAMGIFNMAVPLGTVLAANLFGYLGQLFAWRFIMLGIAIFGGVILTVVFFALSLPKGKESSNSKTSPGEPQEKFKISLGLWLLAAIWALANAQLLAYVTFAPQFYQSVGMSVQRAGLLTSFVMLMSIFIAPLVGIIIDKTGQKKPLLIIGNILLAISFVFIVKPLLGLSLWAVVLGIGFAPIPVFVFSLLPEMVSPHQVGMGLGMLTAASNLGTTLGPAMFGSILDLTAGKFLVPFVILSVVSFLIIFISFGLKVKPAYD